MKRTDIRLTSAYPVSRYRLLRNINGLTEGKSAYGGLFGKITCIKRKTLAQPRLFTVRKSSLIRNGGVWTFTALRKAICTSYRSNQGQ